MAMFTRPRWLGRGERVPPVVLRIVKPGIFLRGEAMVNTDSHFKIGAKELRSAKNRLPVLLGERIPAVPKKNTDRQLLSKLWLIFFACDKTHQAAIIPGDIHEILIGNRGHQRPIL